MDLASKKIPSLKFHIPTQGFELSATKLVYYKDMDELIRQLLLLASKKDRLLIAIDGRGGSGKSMLAKYLQGKIPNSTILPSDDFLHSGLLKPEIERLKKEVLIPFKNGKVASYQKYNWESHELSDFRTIKPEGVLIVEGVYTLSDEMVNLFDYRIWIEYPADLGKARGLKRDRKEYKVETGEYWDKWIVKEKEYIEKEHPQEKANYIVEDNLEFKK